MSLIPVIARLSFSRRQRRRTLSTQWRDRSRQIRRPGAGDSNASLLCLYVRVLRYSSER